MAKRLFDILFSFFFLLVFSPFLLLVALAVKLQDGGPVLHRRRVVNASGEFDALKFRTMRVDADRYLDEHPELRIEFEKNFKLKKDPRVTPLGTVLRKFSIDEIPQFLNVLSGQMSVVGPRMITREELARYAPNEQALLAFKPGITGYWQVNGRQTVSYDDRVRMDLYYVANWNFLMDIGIVLQTPARVARGEGAH